MLEAIGWLAYDEHHRIGIGRDAMRNGGNEIKRSGSPQKATEMKLELNPESRV